MVMTANRL